MRHKKRLRRLSRNRAERNALLQSLAASLFLYKKVETTVAKVEELKRFSEKLITLAKKNTTHSRRLAFAKLQNKDIVRILFEEIAPIFKDRNGGYTRFMRTRARHGDGAQLAICELVAKPSANVKKMPVKEKPSEPIPPSPLEKKKPPEEVPPKKRGFFQKLFRRREK